MKKQWPKTTKAAIGLLLEILYALLITGVGGAIALSFAG